MYHCCENWVIVGRFLFYTQQILNFDFESLSIFRKRFKKCLLSTLFNSCESNSNELIKNLLTYNLSLFLVASFSTLLFLGMKVKRLNDLIKSINFIVCNRVLCAYHLWYCFFNESLLINWGMRGSYCWETCFRYRIFNDEFQVSWEIYK